MNFSSEVSSLIKPFIKSFGKCDKASLSSEDKKSFQNILNTLYQDILKSYGTAFNSNCFKHQVVNLSTYSSTAATHAKRPEDFNSRFFPLIIQKYIKENELYQLQFFCGNVGGREIEIIFTLFDEKELLNINNYVEHARLMYIWLNICAKYADKHCTKTLSIYIYPTPFNKNLPMSATTIIGPEHVNTAFTMACAPKGQIVVFREEEWFKVFIHESFHAYGLDFATTSTKDSKEFKNEIAAIFPIESDFDLYEAYTEAWARIINCLLCSFNALSNKKDKKAFNENFSFCIELERMFALYQCNKVLSFMGLHYNDLHNKTASVSTNKLYKETTHVFAYYVLTAVFLNDYEGYLIWCGKNNHTLLKFNASEQGFQAFLSYIKSVHTCAPLQNSIDVMGRLMEQINKANKNDMLKKSTRMSLISL